METKPPANPVSDADAAEFNRYLQRWRDILNLRDWRVQLQVKRDKASAAVLLKAELEHRLAKIAVGTDFGPNMPVTPYTLEQIAVHEMLHLFLVELIQTTIAEREHNNTVLAAEHAVVITLTDLLMKAYGESTHAQPQAE